MKTCIRCGEGKPLSAYYRHSQMKDGHLSVCKECVKARVADYRQRNLEKVQAYDRQRGLLPHRKAANAARAHRYVGKYEAFKDRHPEKRAAHVIVGNAIRDGRLTPQPCEWCRTDKHVHAHHEDYSKPLDVMWLCKTCHGARHRQINEERRQEAG